MLKSNLLRGEKVYLAAWTKDDYSVAAAWSSNTEFSRLLDAAPARPRPASDIEEWIEEARKSKSAFSFAIRLIESDQLIGLVELEDIEWPHGVAWLGIGIGEPAYWGGGYGTEAASLMLGFAFWELNLHRVQLTVFSYNARAIASYEKLGFVREGVFREFLQRDGKRYDMYLYGLLRHEWDAQHKTSGS